MLKLGLSAVAVAPSLMRPSAHSSYVNAPCFSKVASALRPVTVREYNSLPQALTPFAKALAILCDAMRSGNLPLSGARRSELCVGCS